jgi:ankyrin repeat protein
MISNAQINIIRTAILSNDINELDQALTSIPFNEILIDKMNAMEYAVVNNSLSAVKCIYAHFELDSINGDELIFAAGYGFMDIMESLIGWGDNINRAGYLGFTPLIIAAQEGKTDIVKRLLIYGADKWNYKAYGQSAIYVAAAEGHIEIVKLLYDGSLEHADEINDALIIAGINDKYDVVNLLIDYGVNVNATDDDGRTLLFYALVYNKAELIDILFSNGASVDYTDTFGVSLRRMFEDEKYRCRVSKKIKRGAY